VIHLIQLLACTSLTAQCMSPGHNRAKYIIILQSSMSDNRAFSMVLQGKVPWKISGLACNERQVRFGCESLVARQFRLNATSGKAARMCQSSPRRPPIIPRVCASRKHLLHLSTAPSHHTTSHLLATASMSATQQEQGGQAQASATPVVGTQNIDTLQSMLNLVLLQSGRFIKEHQSGGGTGRQKLAFQRAVPIATERWHDALDELENEVRLAKIVLRRDLALLKQDRKKREIAAKEKEAEKARLAAESRNVGTIVKQPEPVVEKVSTPAQPEVPAEKEPEKESEPDKPMDHEEETVPPPIDTLAAQEAERDPLFDGTPTTANPQENEFDFDAMFGDAMDTSGDNNTQDNIMDTSGDMDFNFDEGPSLLRGLEDFAKDSVEDNNTQNNNGDVEIDIDITMPDLPGLNTSNDTAALTEQPAPIKVSTPPPPAPTEPATNTDTNNLESNDTADAANNDVSNDDLMGGMITDNLDDLFNMDEYENPEQSSFDDAFFNFE
jgi:hypothetical protein